MHTSEIGRKIASKRIEKGVTQAALAHTLGIYQSDISEYENGTKSPTWDTIVKLAAVFEIEVFDLLPISGYQINNNTFNNDNYSSANLASQVTFNFNISPKSITEFESLLAVIKQTKK